MSKTYNHTWILSLILSIFYSINCSAKNGEENLAVLKGKIVYSNGVEKEGRLLFPYRRQGYQEAIKFKGHLDEEYTEVDINDLNFIYVDGGPEKSYLFACMYSRQYGRLTKNKILVLVPWVNESCFLAKGGSAFYFWKKDGGILTIVDAGKIYFGIHETNKVQLIGQYYEQLSSHEILETVPRNWKRSFRVAMKRTFEESCPEFYKMYLNDSVTIKRPQDFIDKYHRACGDS
ncbi:MAG: hypothetical protein DWQ49_15245 [Bacteroidetes bacterium]|nr:MAG: hypothetical protein DWQ49_15245 [Bacteroidota bacterium]